MTARSPAKKQILLFCVAQSLDWSHPSKGESPSTRKCIQQNVGAGLSLAHVMCKKRLLYFNEKWLAVFWCSYIRH